MPLSSSSLISLNLNRFKQERRLEVSVSCSFLFHQTKTEKGTKVKITPEKWSSHAVVRLIVIERGLLGANNARTAPSKERLQKCIRQVNARQEWAQLFTSYLNVLEAIENNLVRGSVTLFRIFKERWKTGKYREDKPTTKKLYQPKYQSRASLWHVIRREDTSINHLWHYQTYPFKIIPSVTESFCAHLQVLSCHRVV